MATDRIDPNKCYILLLSGKGYEVTGPYPTMENAESNITIQERSTGTAVTKAGSELIEFIAQNVLEDSIISYRC